MTKQLKRWRPSDRMTRLEERIMKRLKRTRKLFAFLRRERRTIFTDEFQSDLESMYRRTGAGAEPNPPALMCMAVLLQGYFGASDAEAVELSVMDRRWQLVLGTLGEEEPAFSQGGLQSFRERLIAHDMDRRLLERTVEVAKQTKEFDWKKLPKSLRVGMDSRPLVGAGKVEDTINLLGHAAKKIVSLAAAMTGREPESICRSAKCRFLAQGSIKRALDVNWNDDDERAEALNELVGGVDRLMTYVETRVSGIGPEELQERLDHYIKTVKRVEEQNLEEKEGGAQIRKGVAPDRLISVEEQQMRHGRKSRSKRFNGYKEHVGADLDTRLILACAVTAANIPEEEAAADMKADIERQGLEIDTLQIDRGYVNSPIVDEIEKAGGKVLCKPWKAQNSHRGCFNKTDFKIDCPTGTIACPAGEVEAFEEGRTVQFDPEACGPCQLRSKCTHSASGKGRTVHIGENEQRQQRFRKLQASKAGRARLRGRTGVEHNLAHVAQRKGNRARYRGARKNLYDLRRAATLQNLETIQRNMAE